jgi:predicted dithiol-disulfide oxidoreductase (DUF899 family)
VLAGSVCPPAAETGNQGNGEIAATKDRTGTRREWLAARIELLEAEKELTRRSDELARER